MKKPQLMTLLEVKHYRNDKCIWDEYNVPNTWHNEGQEFVLANSFDTDFGITTPEYYYIGLDNRTTLDVIDTLDDLVGEPSTNGYSRVAISSTTGFVLGIENNVVKATSAIATFVATTGSWGPIQNAFLTTSNDESGYLISSAQLSSERTVEAGDSLTVRINLSLAGC